MADNDTDRLNLETGADDLSAGIDPRDDDLAFAPVKERRPKRKLPTGMLALILAVVAGAGAGAWIGWGENYFFGKSGEMIIVRAEEGPMKVRPASPGGLDVPNRDKLVYERLEKKPPEVKTETLLPRPEVPLPPPAKTPVTPPAIKLPAAAVPPSIETAAGKPTAVPPVTASPAKPVLKKPLPVIIEASKPPPSVPPPPPRAKTNPPPTTLAARTAKPAAPKKPAAATSGFQIQIAAVRTEKAARNEWSRLQKKYRLLLGKLNLSVIKADLGSRGVFYRLRAGPLASRDRAKRVCGELTRQKVGCLVVSPGR